MLHKSDALGPKTLFQIFVFFTLMGCMGAGMPINQELQMENNIVAFDYNTFSASYANDKLGDLRNQIKIVYYKDYVLYETTVLKTKSELDENGKEIIRIDYNTKDMFYLYYIIKKGAEKGLMFYNLERSKIFVYKNFLNDMSLDFEKYSLFNLKFGKLAKVERGSQKGMRIEKFAPEIKTGDNPDSIFCFYDQSLKEIDFSFNPAVDKKSNSKLWKIAMIYNARQKPIEHPTYQVYWEFKRSNLSDKKKYLDYFQKFISVHENNLMAN